MFLLHRPRPVSAKYEQNINTRASACNKPPPTLHQIWEPTRTQHYTPNPLGRLSPRILFTPLLSQSIVTRYSRLQAYARTRAHTYNIHLNPLYKLPTHSSLLTDKQGRSGLLLAPNFFKLSLLDNFIYLFF